MDSLFTDTITDKIYAITNDARVYELLQTPVFQFAPVPVHTTPIPLTNNVTNRIYGAANIIYDLSGEMPCSSGITIPVSYNCTVSVALNQVGCIDPGNGTGTYTGTTALADCQNQSPTANPPGCIVKWDCESGLQAGNCQQVQHYLPHPLVYNKFKALEYIASPLQNLQGVVTHLISYGGLSPQPGQCYYPFPNSNGGPALTRAQWRIDYWKVPAVSPQPMYVWNYFINQCINAGVPVNTSMDFATVQLAIVNHFNLPLVSPFHIYQEPCICTNQPCSCIPSLGSQGQYPTEAACLAPCCGPQPCHKCCKPPIGPVQLLPANTYPCECPSGWVHVPCPFIQPPQPRVKNECSLGYYWDYLKNRCVCTEKPCPPRYYWNDVSCGCLPIGFIEDVPSDKYFDPKSIDVTLARGVLPVEASAATFTNIATNAPTTATSTKQKRYAVNADGGCTQCKEGETDAYYTVNDCIYTEPTCAAGSKVKYYICTTATNTVVSETQRVCAPQDTQPDSSDYYDSLEACLNSGCAGFMWCEVGQSVNGVRQIEDAMYSPIPMCCDTMIKNTPKGDWEYEYTESGPLTVDLCVEGCADTPDDIWYPLYNAFGTNTYNDSMLAYLTRELLLQVNIGQCLTKTTAGEWATDGSIKQNPY